MSGSESRGCRDCGRRRVAGHQGTRERKSGNQFQPRPQAAASTVKCDSLQLPGVPGTAAIDRGNSACEPLNGYSYGTTEKINRACHAAFPPPLLPISREACIANKGLIWFAVRFRTFFGLPNLTKFYQILPISTKSVQRRVSNRASKRGSGRAIYLNRVKSRGSCQAVTGAPPCWLSA